MNLESENTVRESKKRTNNSSNYKRNVIKKAKLQGIDHINHVGKSVPAKKTGESCSCNLKCFNSISKDNQLDILTNFLNIPTKNQQDLFLQGLIECCDVKRHRNRKNSNSERNKSFIYHVMVGDVRKKICRQAFFSLYAVTNERVKRIRRLLCEGKIPDDKRGKQSSINAVSGEQILLVHNHISSFPVKQSHYSGRNIHYLDSELTVKRMYDLFKISHPKSVIKYEYYNKIFKENFNLTFGRPQVDTCCECEQLSVKIKSKTLNDVAKRVASAELIVHKRRAKKFYASLEDAKKICKEKSDTVALCFDFMQNVNMPKIPVQDLFYLRKLTVSVFCIYNMKTEQPVLFIYHEGNGKKGPNDVCSFLMEYIQEYIDDNCKNLIIFSDNCPGQNKNQIMVRFCLALVETRRFSSIEHYFPIRGHSFLPCDRVFGVIKRHLRKIDRIYTIKQLVEYIVESSEKMNFIVHLIESKDIIDFKTWWSQFYLKSCLSLETNKRDIPRNMRVSFTISKFHYFKYDGQLPGVVTAREYIGGLAIHTFPMKIKGNINVVLPSGRAYMEELPINEKKMNDIKKCVNYVPEEEKDNFWNEILQWPTKITEECDD
jgi:hypothetical protein